MIREELLRKIQVYFRDRDDTVAVYLFGSHAKGTARPLSDVDLAVLFTDNQVPFLRFQKKLRVTADLEDLLACPVDVVDIRSADLPFFHQVMLNKVLVYERDRTSRVAFEVDSRKRYFDIMPMLARHHAQARKRILERDTQYHGR